MSASKPLTDREAAVLDYMAQHRAARGYYPSSRQIAENFGWKSQTSAVRVLRSLTDKGWIAKPSERRHTVVVLSGPHRDNDAALVAELRAWGKMMAEDSLNRLLRRAADRIAEMLGPLKA